MPATRITSLDDPRVGDYAGVRDADLMRGRGLFMAEGRFVVETLLTRSVLRPRSIFVADAARQAMDALLEDIPREIPVYVATQDVMNEVVGFDIHRGCLAAGERPAARDPGALLAQSRGDRACVIPMLGDLTNHDNIGGVFRCALAFGSPSVVLTSRCCDPLYRKAIRVSMGAALRVPFARGGDERSLIDCARQEGLEVVGLSTGGGAVPLDEFATCAPSRVALLLGSEGQGISPAAMERCDRLVRIPMVDGVDSLNVVAACAVALHVLAGVGRAQEVRSGP